jgi:hypothetical protein
MGRLFVFPLSTLKSLLLLGGLQLSLLVMVMVSIGSRIVEVGIHSMKLKERCGLFGS